MHGRGTARGARQAVRSLGKAEIALLIASQSAARARILASVDAAINTLLASAVAAVIARFASRRMLATALAPDEQRAALSRLADEQAAEIARLSREFAGERRRLRRQALGAIAASHKTDRRQLSTRLRAQRIVFAMAIRAMGGSQTGAPAEAARNGFARVQARRFRRGPKS